MKQILISSGQLGSIGEITRDLVSRLEKHFEIEWLNGDVKNGCIELTTSMSHPDIFLCHFMPQKAILQSTQFKQAKTRIIIQPIDGTVFTEQFVRDLNSFDWIFTPGSAGKSIMQINGVHTPIIVVPNYFKAELFEKPKLSVQQKRKLSKLDNLLKGKFVFYHESTHHARKGTDFMYEGFVRAFGFDLHKLTSQVVLLSKDMPPNNVTYEQNEQIKARVKKLHRATKTPPQIYKISQYLEPEVLKYLWQRANAYVGISHIEGFGIPHLRFAALGKPIIALQSELNGYCDFLNQSNSYLIPTYQGIASQEHMNIYHSNQTLWSFPSMRDVEYAYRKVFIDYKVGRLKTPKLTDIDRMGFDVVVDQYVNLLQIL